MFFNHRRVVEELGLGSSTQPSLIGARTQGKRFRLTKYTGEERQGGGMVSLSGFRHYLHGPLMGAQPHTVSSTVYEWERGAARLYE